MKKIIPLVLFTLLFAFCSDEKKLLRKASNAVVQSDFDKAINYYDQVIQKNENSFFGNAGKGIVLSEFMERHEQAIPYLEKALKNSPDKSKPIINRDLGKSYHFVGNYERALYYYQRTDNDPDFSDYDEFLTKRIADCRFAIEHPKVALPENQSVKNVGNTINTSDPEYTPVAAEGKLFFSSKRKDTPQEKKNGFDGRYYENIYVSTIKADGSYSNPVVYDLPVTRMEKKRGESIMSASHDGKKIFIFKGGKIYETNTNDLAHKPEKLGKKVNFAHLQNHAALSPDENTLYFSAVSEGRGRGGSDIYVSKKTADGKWGDPELLGDGVNTGYDEDSPYLSENGTLFFSSNGHPGYGGFDVYKSKLENGTWTKAENLGQPINSAGDDIYFTLINNTSNGYYASARPGGYGDLDIYKVHYLSTEVLPCKPDNILTINTQADPGNPYLYNVEVQVPEAYKNNIRQYAWEVNGKPIVQTSDKFQYTFAGSDTFKLATRLVAYCDTCPTLLGMCAEKSVVVAGKLLNEKGLASADNTKVATNTAANTNAKTGKEKNSNRDASRSKNKPGKSKYGNQSASEENEENATGNTKNENSGGSYAASGSGLSESQLKTINWNTTPAYFDKGRFSIREEAKEMLDQNIKALKNKNNLVVKINGYADSRGSENLNKALSGKRANAVKQYLVSHGVSSKRIKAVNAMGETQLVNNCSDGVDCSEDQHQQNRRVEFTVMEGPVKQPGSITLK
jgi:outer membrane protein OmpA-like peptidoglycan-associated protein